MNQLSYKTSPSNRIQTMRFHPFVFLPERMRTACDRSGANGKEKDPETGYGYFGARYMDHELMTMWLSIDPLSDKYPNISPYAYCMWNPVKLIDPDGRDTIRINLNEGSFEQTRADGNHSVQFYKDGKLAGSVEIEKKFVLSLFQNPRNYLTLRMVK